MYKEKLRKATAFIILVMLMMLLGGCGVKKLSGTYVNELDRKNYLKFSGKSKVTLHNENGKITGSYRIKDDLLVLYFDTEEGTMAWLEIEDKKTLYDGMTAYVKKGFLERNWLKILIFTIVFGTVMIVYEKITGRELVDDMEKWEEKFEHIMDGPGNREQDSGTEKAARSSSGTEPAEPESAPAEQEAETASAEQEEIPVIYCAHCGKQIPENAVFCIYCGEKTDNSAT